MSHFEQDDEDTPMYINVINKHKHCSGQMSEKFSKCVIDAKTYRQKLSPEKKRKSQVLLVVLLYMSCLSHLGSFNRLHTLISSTTWFSCQAHTLQFGAIPDCVCR